MKESNMSELKTSITMVLDRSGSMESCRKATINAVNSYLLEARADKALKDAEFELTIFDSESIDTIRSGKTSDIKDIGLDDFVPRAGTPLFDAIGRGIDSLDTKAKNSKAVLVVMTDGQENQSRKHTLESVSTLLKDRQEKGWLIVFLGAGLSAAQQGTAMGIRAARVANIGMDEVALTASMSRVRCMIDDYAATSDMEEAQAYADTVAFSAEARQAMGDASAGAGLVPPPSGAPVPPVTRPVKTKPIVQNSDDAWKKASGDAWGN
jgi:hypothetical protein